MQISNPVLGGFHPDPSVCRFGDWYYLATSSFEFTPGIPLYRSRDLVHWEAIGHVCTRPSQLDLSESKASQGLWAPTLRVIRGRLAVMVTHVSERPWPELFRNCLFTAEDPHGPWSDPIWIDDGGIDPDLCEGPDGRVWYLRNGSVDGVNGLMIAEFDWDQCRLASDPKLAWIGAGDDYVEAPHLYHLGDYFYLMAAEGGTATGHCVTLARSSRSADEPTGAWESCPHNPILTNRGTSRPISSVGHGDLVGGPDGRWWMLALGVRDPNGLSPLGRETMLAPVTWVDDWPVVGHNGRLDELVEVPHCDRPQAVSWELNDDFRAADRPMWWNRRHDPDSEAMVVDDDALRLKSTGRCLTEPGPIAFLGCRQQTFTCRSEVTLDAGDLLAGAAAGLVVYATTDHHAGLWLVRDAADHGGEVGWRLEVRSLLGGTPAILTSHHLETAVQRLIIVADRERYAFHLDSSEGEPLATVAAVHLASVVAGTFTGAYHALVCEGPAGATATFHAFHHRAWR